MLLTPGAAAGQRVYGVIAFPKMIIKMLLPQVMPVRCRSRWSGEGMQKGKQEMRDEAFDISGFWVICAPKNRGGRPIKVHFELAKSTLIARSRFASSSRNGTRIMQDRQVSMRRSLKIHWYQIRKQWIYIYHDGVYWVICVTKRKDTNVCHARKAAGERSCWSANRMK